MRTTSDYVLVNGGRLEFDVGVRKTVEGIVGFIYMRGVEVYQTPPMQSRDAAYHAARSRMQVFAL